MTRDRTKEVTTNRTEQRMGRGDHRHDRRKGRGGHSQNRMEGRGVHNVCHVHTCFKVLSAVLQEPIKVCGSGNVDLHLMVPDLKNSCN